MKNRKSYKQLFVHIIHDNIILIMASSPNKYEDALPVETILTGGKNTYRIEEVLGQGGYGITYRVSTRIVHGNIPVTVHFAVKEFFVKGVCERISDEVTMTYSKTFKEDVKESLKDFIAEGKRLAQICRGNRNIVNVNEVFEANGTAYYVMEYIDGGSLKDVVRRKGRLMEVEALGLIRPIARAVSYIHKERLLHLDIKPENIMIRKGMNGNPPEPVLIDFGIALHFKPNGSLTSKHNSVFTSHGYSPQEQYAGITRFAPEADVYALAATLFYLLVGRNPVSAFDVKTEYVRENLPQYVSEKVCSAIIQGMKPLACERIQTVDSFSHYLFNTIAEGTEDKNPTRKFEKNASVANSVKNRASQSYVSETEQKQWIDGYRNRKKQQLNQNSINKVGISIFKFDQGNLWIDYSGKQYGDSKRVFGQLQIGYNPASDAPITIVEQIQREIPNTIAGVANAFLKSIKACDDPTTLNTKTAYTIATYRTFDDYMILMRNNCFKRIIQEQQLMALVLYSHKESIRRLVYGDLYCDVATGGGILEIVGAGEQPAPESDYIQGVDYIEHILPTLAACATVYYSMAKKPSPFRIIHRNTVLLCTFPFDIHLYQIENGRIRDDLGSVFEKGWAIPCKKCCENIPIACEELGLEIAGRMFFINFLQILGYRPYRIQLSIDIDAASMLSFIFKDCRTGKENKVDFATIIAMNSKERWEESDVIITGGS